MSNLTWFLHKPTDEREQALYQRAYQTAFYTVSTCLIALLFIVWTFPSLSLDTFSLGVVIVAILMLAYVSGWMMLRKEDITFKSAVTTVDIRKKLRNYWIFLLAFAVLNLVLILLHPELYLRFALSYGSLVYFCSLGTAFGVGKVFPLPVRIALAIFLPVPTIIWLSVGRGSIVKKLAVVIALSVAFAVSMVVMIIAVRQFIVSPYYIATDAFAPTYTKGQYVLLSYRQVHPTVGQYIMYYNIGEAPKVGQVLTVTTTGDYNIKTSDGDKMIGQEYLLGTILPGDSMFDWLRAE